MKVLSPIVVIVVVVIDIGVRHVRGHSVSVKKSFYLVHFEKGGFCMFRISCIKHVLDIAKF